jgi:hypothetical protein
VNAEALLRDLESRGVHVEANGDRLHYRGPHEVLTPATLDALRAHKADLLALLAGNSWPPYRQFIDDSIGVACDAPTLPQTALDHASTFRAAWRRACFELGEMAGWPELPFKQGRSVAPGAAPWGKWLAHASVPDMVCAMTALHEYLARLPGPPAAPLTEHR